MPFLVSVSKAFKLLSSNVVVGVLSEWIGPSVDLLKTLSLLSSDIMLWLIWLVWSKVVKSARTSVGSGIVVPLVVSVSNAFQFLGSDIIVSVFTKWIVVILHLMKTLRLLGSDVMLWLVWLVWSI